MKQELIIEKQYNDIHEIKNDISTGITDDDGHNENLVRIYCTSVQRDGKSNFNFQIRTFKPIVSLNSKAKPRDMVATTYLTINEVREILKYMEDYEKQPY